MCNCRKWMNVFTKAGYWETDIDRDTSWSEGALEGGL